MQIAKTILEQICAIDPWALAAWGAKDYLGLPKGVAFKTSGFAHWKGTVTITLDESKDLYIVKFSRLRKLKVIVDKVVSDVFVEDLVNIIEEQVR